MKVRSGACRTKPTRDGSRADRHFGVTAHRGFSAAAPENTVPPEEAAAAAGADMVERDVQRTSDGHPIVVHDKTSARTTDVATVFPGRAKDPAGSFSLAEVQRLDAGSWKGARSRGTQVPTLQACVRAVVSPMSGSIPWAGPGQDTATMMRRDARLGVAGVITNRPDMARIQMDSVSGGRA